METFDIEDSNTGMKIQVRGNRAPAQDEIPSMFATARKTAAASLAKGEYKMTEDFQKVSKPERREKIKQLSAAALGTSVDSVDVEEGMGVMGRQKLSFQPTPQDKMKQLEDDYGRENVTMLEIDGDAKMFYRDENETENKWRIVDEVGFSLADVIGDTAGEVLPTAGAIAGGIAGAAGGPAGIVAGSAAGYAGVASAQDVATRALSDEPIRPGDIAKRTAIETSIGAVADVATLKLGGIVARRFGQDSGAKLLKSIQGASERTGIELTAAQRIGKDTIESAQEIGGVRPQSRIGRLQAGQRDEIYARWKTALEGGEVDPTDAFATFVDDTVAANRSLVDEVAKTNKKAAQDLENVLQRDIDAVAAPRVNMDQLGKGLRTNLLDPAQANISETSKRLFTGLRKMGEGVEIPRKPVVSAIRSAVKSMEPFDDAASRRIAKEIDAIAKDKPGEKLAILGARGEELRGTGTAGQKNMTFAELKDRMDQINDVISRNKEAGFSTKERVASRVFENLKGLRDKTMANSPELQEAWGQTMDFYKTNVLGTKRGSFGAATREVLADTSLTPSAAVARIISDPEHIKETARLVRVGGQDPEALLNPLRQAYASRKLGLYEGADASTLTNKIVSEEQRDVVEELFGKKFLRNLGILQNRLSQFKNLTRGDNPKLATVSMDEIDGLMSAFGTDNVKKIASDIGKRMVKEAELRRIANNKILSKVAKGVWDENSSADIAKAMLTGTPTQVKEALNAIPASARPAIKQEVTASLFSKFRGSGAQLGSNEVDVLWNPEMLSRSLRKDKKFWQNAESVLGKGAVQAIKDTNELLSVSAVKSGKDAADIQPRFLLPGPVLYFVGDLFGGISNRFLGWAYGSDALVPLLKLTSKRVSPEQAEQNFSQMILPLLMSDKGLMALSREAANDPSIDQSLIESFREMPPPEQGEQQQ